MEGTKNINKKLLITIFTFLFLIGFIYSVYPQATSPQNNAASSLESNSIIQWIVNSSANGYSTAAQYLVNFLSIKGVPNKVWVIIIFLMTTLFFIGIYAYIFEIFVQKIQGNGKSESDTMKKAKILFIFALSVFSAMSIGFAIPFLFSLYGFILLIVLLIVLFFFGRAIISYGRIFHYSVDRLADEVKRDLTDVGNKASNLPIPKEEAARIKQGIEDAKSIVNEAESAFRDANKKFENALSTIIHENEEFINSLIKDYNDYLNNYGYQLKSKDDLENLIRNLEKKRDSLRSDTQNIQSIRQLYDDISEEIRNLGLDDNNKEALQNILGKVYGTTLSKYQQKVLSEINEAISAYEEVGDKLDTFYTYEEKLKGYIGGFRGLLRTYGDKQYESAMLSRLEKSKEKIDGIERTVNERINFLKKLLH